MAINHIYAPDPQFAAQAISQAGAAEYQQGQDDRLRAIEQFNAQLEQRDRQFYDNLAYQQDGQLLNYVANQDQLAFSGAQANQNRQAGLAEAEMRNQYGLADTALRGNLQAAMQGRESAGMMARDMQETRLKQAMSEHDAIQKAWLDGEHFTSDDQFKQAKGAWEKKWGSLGLSWGLPDQIAQQQAQQNDEQKIALLESGFKSRFTGDSLIPEGQIKTWLELGVEPKDIMAAQIKYHAEDRQAASLQQKERQEEIKYQESSANMKRDDERANQQLEHTRQSAEQKAAMAAEQHKQKMMMNAVNSYQAAKLKWATAKNAAFDAEGKASLGPEPKLEDFMLPEMQESGGEIITNKAGRRARLHPDGSVTPID